MPATPWTGYGRFCPLSRALDVIGERWTLVIVQELLKQPRRYGALLDRLPGISTSVLADRLRRLERAGVVAREPGAPGAHSSRRGNSGVLISRSACAGRPGPELPRSPGKPLRPRPPR